MNDHDAKSMLPVPKSVRELTPVEDVGVEEVSDDLSHVVTDAVYERMNTYFYRHEVRAKMRELIRPVLEAAVKRNAFTDGE